MDVRKPVMLIRNMHSGVTLRKKLLPQKMQVLVSSYNLMGIYGQVQTSYLVTPDLRTIMDGYFSNS